jgi:hypothetical protein
MCLVVVFEVFSWELSVVAGLMILLRIRVRWSTNRQESFHCSGLPSPRPFLALDLMMTSGKTTQGCLGAVTPPHIRASPFNTSPRAHLAIVLALCRSSRNGTMVGSIFHIKPLSAWPSLYWDPRAWPRREEKDGTRLPSTKPQVSGHAIYGVQPGWRCHAARFSRAIRQSSAPRTCSTGPW